MSVWPPKQTHTGSRPAVRSFAPLTRGVVVHGKAFPVAQGKESTCDAGEQTRVLSLGWEDPLEEETETHSSVLAWRIPGMEEPATIYGVTQSQTRLKRLSSRYF